MADRARRMATTLTPREEAVLREIEERIEKRTFELVERADAVMRMRAGLLFGLYAEADARTRAELISIEQAQEYFSGQVRTYLEAKGFATWDDFLKPSLSETENVRLRGAITEDWMKLPGSKNDPIAMYLLLMKHEVFGLTGPRLDDNGLDWVQEVLAPSE